jgi:hypothetical protein
MGWLFRLKTAFESVDAVESIKNTSRRLFSIWFYIVEHETDCELGCGEQALVSSPQMLIYIHGVLLSGGIMVPRLGIRQGA